MERGRVQDREDVPPPRKSSRSRERGVVFEEEGSEDDEKSEIKILFNSTYKRLLKAPDAVKVFEGAEDLVKELINEKFFKERQKFIRERTEYEEKVRREREVFEAREKEFQDLDAVFQKIAISQAQAQAPTAQTSTVESTASTATSAPVTSGYGLNIFGSR